MSRIIRSNITKPLTQFLEHEEISDLFSIAVIYILIIVVENNTEQKHRRPKLVEDMKKKCLNQIADLAFKNKSKITHSRLRYIIKKIFFDIVSQGVFYSMFYAFPKSRNKFDTNFKEFVFSEISFIFKGFKISSASVLINNWKFIDDWYLDLGSGNLLSSNKNISFFKSSLESVIGRQL